MKNNFLFVIILVHHFLGIPCVSCVRRNGKQWFHIHLVITSLITFPALSQASTCSSLLLASSFATSLFQWGPYPPGAGELRTVEQVDKYLETAIPPDFWAHCWLCGHSHKAREGKHSQETKKKGAVTSLCRPKAPSYSIEVHYSSSVCSYPDPSSAIATIKNDKQTIFYRPCYSRQYHKPLSNWMRIQSPGLGWPVLKTQPNTRASLCQQTVRK